MKYKLEDSDWPTKEDLAHLPRAYPYEFSDIELDELIERNITARATHLQSHYVERWGADLRKASYCPTIAIEGEDDDY
jgi:hypothetical protein